MKLRSVWGVLVLGGVLASPAMAWAAEAVKVAAPLEGHARAFAIMAKAFGAALSVGLSALGAGYAQAKIGSAGAGTLAERPEAAVYVITLQALPEIIVLLGLVGGIVIINLIPL
jgi:V/A-type H+/Na+-transporting ATPase subunit K